MTSGEINSGARIGETQLETEYQQVVARHIKWIVGDIGEQRFKGWILSEDPPSVRFFVNDRAVTEFEYPIPSPNLAARFWAVDAARSARFTCTISSSHGDIFGSTGFAKLTALDDTISRRDSDRTAHYLFDPRRELPAPGGENMQRVIATDKLNLFLFSGATAVKRAEWYLKTYLHIDLSSCRVLDWGFGSGRLTRYFTSCGCQSIAGADIDQVNVDWCSKNLPGINFARVSTRPPMPFASNSFDFIIGMSVFTHIKEREQLAWLEELQRISASGAILMMSFAGQSVLGMKGFREPLLRQMKDVGFFLAGVNNSVASGADDTEFYVNVVHTAEYIRNTWSKYFDIVAIEPALLGMQDVVVMRNPK